ncbi:MAG: response regulator transcription factor [Lachnospiraceae bacterium]|nr:response regulator transcription factor [Lachnospiraceae bacterium]MDY5741428.1 response regulator transcription factor [Lachnospiraceae bacterium]
MRVLIVDRDILLTTELTELGMNYGIETYIASNGVRGFELFSKYAFDAVITELLLPRMDGLSLVKEIRLRSDLPILVVTASTDLAEKKMAYLVGADDVTAKPIELELLILKLLAIRGRSTPAAGSGRPTAIGGNPSSGKTRLAIANMVIDLESFDVKIDGEQIILTPKEIELLWLLASNAQKVFTRENLLESLWDVSFDGDIRTVDSHIKRMRVKLNRIAHPQWEIKTIWGVGYQFVTRSV